MGIKEDYSRWPLGRQLQVIFIISGFLLTLILVIITRFQLDWLRDKIINDSTKCLEDSLIYQMRKLGQIESEFLSSEFSNYIAHVRNHNYTDRNVQGYSKYSQSPFKPAEYWWHTSIKEDYTDYEKAAYFSKFGQDAVVSIMEKDSAMNSIYNLTYSKEYISLYQGFKEKELLHYYPGVVNSLSDYTPLVREWYYKAQTSIGNVVITEPYQDATTNQWIISISTAMLDGDGKMYGVAAADVGLKELTDKTSAVKILDTGFFMLISSGGMILTMPESWKPSDTTLTLRVFDTTYTGISKAQWEAMKASVSGSRHDFTDINGTLYYTIKHDITPYIDSKNITHYLLVCAKKIESEEAKNSIENNFSKTYIVIFWVVLSIAIIVFILVGLLIYFVSRKLSFQMKMIEKIFGKIIRRGLFPKMAKGIYFNKLEDSSKGIETLVDACKIKVQRVKDLEENFAYYKWGLTRPNDVLMYQKWTDCLYPYSLHTDKPSSWRHMLPELNRVF
ncbi:hypothetical protein SteCoe_33816 [Stentor coeruleus]|uniref:Cache domain-containing protein n=1 Tax=Stentor coeruleus TaxID=5963 RepID=A0A1R2AW55_9CILI|nr:hypothetical protein SteCoe_33816 [Stentor coeruleus]